jgi:hypothetical protein
LRKVNMNEYLPTTPWGSGFWSENNKVVVEIDRSDKSYSKRWKKKWCLFHDQCEKKVTVLFVSY